MAGTHSGDYQRAEHFCTALEVTANQVGITEAWMDFVFKDHRFLRLDLQLPGAVAPARPVQSISPYTVADLTHILRELAVARTAGCRVGYGNMLIKLVGGNIQVIKITQSFKMHREMPEFGEAFFR